MKKKRMSLERKTNLEGYIFVLPWIIGFVAFLAYPFIQSLILAFNEITDIEKFGLKFIGMNNFIKAFTVDAKFIPAFTETIRDTLINLPLIIVYSLFIAILLNRGMKLKGFFRVMFFLPVLLGTGLIMKQLMGLYLDDTLIQEIGASDTEIRRAAGAIILPDTFMTYLGPDFGKIIQDSLDKLSSILWRSGIQIIIFIGGLQSIPQSLYESAYCDGATAWEAFWKITLPIMTPIILINIVYTLIDWFTSIDNKIMEYITDISFKQMQLSYGSALGWIFFIFISILIGLAFLLMGRFIVYIGEK
ncbi:carbohydrate ABC transporter permease [Caldicellulosiruptoraceae bacterium PP1]